MEKFIKELQAFCKRSGQEITFYHDRGIAVRTVDRSWQSTHDPKSLAALIREGLGDRCHKELLTASARTSDAYTDERLQKAVIASREYFARTEKDRDGN